jgi:hypothetical protein
MRAYTVLAVAAISLIAASGCQRHKKAGFGGPPPAYPGSYAQSCRSITTLDGGYISAECADEKGRFVTSFLQAAACKGDIGNNNGMLNCSGAVATTAKPDLLPPGASDTPVSAAASDAPVAAPGGVKP